MTDYFRVRFHGDLVFKFIDGHVWELREPYAADVEDATSGAVRHFDMPVGFLTDNASIPNLPLTRYLFPKSGVYDPIATLHDYLCVEGPKGLCSHRYAHFVWASGVQALPLSRPRKFALQQAVLRFGPRW